MSKSLEWQYAMKKLIVNAWLSMVIGVASLQVGAMPVAGQVVQQRGAEASIKVLGATTDARTGAITIRYALTEPGGVQHLCTTKINASVGSELGKSGRLWFAWFGDPEVPKCSR